MGSFCGECDLTYLEDAETWRVLNNFSYTTNAGETITVTKGLETDLASIPRIFWEILPPFGNYIRAAVVHDTLYLRQPYERSKCDAILLEAMETEGVSWLTRHTIYRAVRMFGWGPYNDHTKKNLIQEKSYGPKPTDTSAIGATSAGTVPNANV